MPSSRQPKWATLRSSSSGLIAAEMSMQYLMQSKTRHYSYWHARVSNGGDGDDSARLNPPIQICQHAMLTFNSFARTLPTPRPHLAHASPAPLSCATDESRRISGGHERVAEVLLRRGAAVERKRADGQTAMMIAAYMGHRGIVRQLVMHQRSAMLAHESLSTPIDVPGAQCDVLKHECHRA